MLIETSTAERHGTFFTVEVKITEYSALDQHTRLFVVHTDRITNEAVVFHQGRIVKTVHDLNEKAEEIDFEAFAVIAVMSLTFNVKG